MNDGPRILHVDAEGKLIERLYEFVFGGARWRCELRMVHALFEEVMFGSKQRIDKELFEVVIVRDEAVAAGRRFDNVVSAKAWAREMRQWWLQPCGRLPEDGREALPVTRDDWKMNGMPAQGRSIPMDRIYSSEEFQYLRLGHIPRDFDDKWFTFYEKPWLYLYHGWSGNCRYQVRFEPTQTGARIVQVLAHDYAETGVAHWLARILDGLAGRP